MPRLDAIWIPICPVSVALIDFTVCINDTISLDAQISARHTPDQLLYPDTRLLPLRMICISHGAIVYHFDYISFYAQTQQSP